MKTRRRNKGSTLVSPRREGEGYISLEEGEREILRETTSCAVLCNRV
jgi:hypothetical protein